MIENFGGESLSVGVVEIVSDPASVEASFVHTDQADGREVILEVAEVVLGIRIEPTLEHRGDRLAFDIERTSRDIHQTIEADIEVSLIGRQISKARHIESDNTNRASRFAA